MKESGGVEKNKNMSEVFTETGKDREKEGKVVYQKRRFFALSRTWME